MGTTTAILFITLGISLIMRVPIGISLGISAVVANAFSNTVSARFMVQSMTMALDTFPLLAVPLRRP